MDHPLLRLAASYARGNGHEALCGVCGASIGARSPLRCRYRACDRDQIVVDALKENISVDDCAVVLNSYGIWQVYGDVGDPSDAGAHAVLGAMHLLSLQ